MCLHSHEVCSAEFDGPLGIEDGDILDSDLSASTMAGTYYRASQARLNNQGTFSTAWTVDKVRSEGEMLAREGE